MYMQVPAQEMHWEYAKHKSETQDYHTAVQGMKKETIDYLDASINRLYLLIKWGETGADAQKLYDQLTMIRAQLSNNLKNERK